VVSLRRRILVDEVCLIELISDYVLENIYRMWSFIIRRNLQGCNIWN